MEITIWKKIQDYYEHLSVPDNSGRMRLLSVLLIGSLFDKDVRGGLSEDVSEWTIKQRWENSDQYCIEINVNIKLDGNWNKLYHVV